MRAQLLVDGHVHFHRCFAWKRFLDATAVNFADARRVLGLGDDSPGCLMFTERSGDNYYGVLLNAPDLVSSLGWEVDRSDSGRSISLSRDGQVIVIVAGRQIVTAENLEVLALGCTHAIADGQPIRTVLGLVAQSGAPAVIPWGFGKWWGGRGRVVRDLLELASDVPFCLGDNAGRARLIGRPSLLEQAESRGLPVLGGTDALAIPSHVGRTGSYGFVLDDWQATSRPASAIVERIHALRRSPRVFGELSSVGAMLRSQLATRLPRSWNASGTRTGDPRAPVKAGRQALTR